MTSAIDHQCPYPASGCTSPDCHVAARRIPQRVREALIVAERDSEITATRPGEVKCHSNQRWHSWLDHYKHVADAQVARLIELGLIVDSSRGS